MSVDFEWLCFGRTAAKMWKFPLHTLLKNWVLENQVDNKKHFPKFISIVEENLVEEILKNVSRCS